jgi:hypothetical protein
MNAWPTLREWMQFGGTLALEILVVFAVAKLVALRARSAQGRRALWQITLLAMLLVSVGELNGVRGWLRLSEKKTPLPVTAAATQKVIVTLKDVEPDLELLRNFEPTTSSAQVQPQPASHPSRWQERTVWPALLWAACAAFVLLRLVIAQGLALRLRLASHRSSGQPCPLKISDAEATADKAVRSSDRAWQIGDVTLRQRLGLLAQALGLRRNVILLTSQRTVAPFTFGVWRPVIVLPQKFSTTFTPEQQDAALAHELAHVAGFDSAWRTLSQSICAVLWWHPLAWLAKRELDHASELVADEASLLVANGPDRLAECLLACAKELRRPALAGWLGMDGGGFRSALGKRVTRLLQLNPHARLSRPVPWYLRLLAPVVCVALLWLGMAVVMKPGAPRDGAWRASILGSAFAAVAEPKEQGTSQEDRRRAEAARLFQDGKLCYETGRLEEARTNLQAALKIEPTNQAAAWYLDAIGKVKSPTDSIMRPTSPKRQAIYEKLRSIRLEEWGPFDNLPLREVIHALSDAARQFDPEHRGLNFLLSPESDLKNFVFDGSVPMMSPETDVGATKIRLGTKLNNLSVEETLNIVMQIGDRKIKYSVEDYGVLISPAFKETTTSQVHNASSTNLQTRFFKVDPNTLEQGLKSISTQGGGGGRGNSERKPLFNPNDPSSVIERVQRLFQAAGVDFSAPGRALFYQDRVGTVMVRATPAEMETVEKAIQLLNMTPPQLTIRVKVMEIAKTNAAETLDWFLGTVLTNPPPQNRADPDAKVPTITGVLTDWQFREVVRALEKRGGTDLLSAPEITTLSGRQAQIKVVDIKYIVTDLDYSAITNNTTPPKKTNATNVTTGGTGGGVGPLIMPIAEPFELGPVIDVVPYVLADGYTIQMTVLPTLKEFLGYDEQKDIWATGGPHATDPSGLPAGVLTPVPLPKFRLRQVATSAMVWDGQTLMIGAGSARTMQRDRDANGIVTTNYTDKELIYFITPRLIDAAGNPLHADDEFPERHKTVPAQRNGGGKP